MPTIQGSAIRSRSASLSTELRLDVLGLLPEYPADELLAVLELGHQGLGLEWTAPAGYAADEVLERLGTALAEATVRLVVSASDDVLARIDQALAEATR